LLTERKRFEARAVEAIQESLPQIEARNFFEEPTSPGSAWWLEPLRQLRDAYLSRLQKNSTACLYLLHHYKAAPSSRNLLSLVPQSQHDEDVLIAMRAKLKLLLKCEEKNYCAAIEKRKFDEARASPAARRPLDVSPHTQREHVG
jgi:hypothetical protein